MYFFIESNPETCSYYSTMYQKADASGEKVEHKIKRGDNLWNLAKSQLNKKNATNQEISDMMYRIARLNNMETLESANNIKIGDIIYLPAAAGTKKSEKPHTAPKTETANLPPEEQVKRTSAEIKKILFPYGEDISYTQQSLLKSRNKKNIPDDLYAKHGKAGMNYWNEVLKNPDEDLRIEKGYGLGSKATALHITQKEGGNPYGKTVAHLYVQTDKNGKIKEVAFNSAGIAINGIRFDYVLDSKGNLQKPDDFGIREIKLEQLPKEQYSEFLGLLQGYIDRELK